MHEDFWHARWARNEIGFHLGEVNPWLRKYWPALDLPAGSRVRAVITLKGYDVIDGGAQMTTEVTIEREGAAKPVCILTPSATVRRIVNMTAMTVADANATR